MLSISMQIFAPHPHNDHKPKLLHNSSLLVLLGLFVMVQSLLFFNLKTKPQVLGYASVIDPQEIVDLTNDQRLQVNEAPLVINQELNQAALAKAVDMFQSNYWAHVSPTGTEPWYFITNAGYQYQHAGENLAKDFSSASNIVSAWMASSSHRRNILDSRFEDIGIAVVDGEIDGVETTLVVQLFGAQSQAAVSTVPRVPSLTSGNLVTQVSASEVSGNKLPEVLPPLTLSKVISLSFAIILIIALAIDWFFVWRKNLVRLSGKNWAHLSFLFTLLFIIIIVKQGLIL